MNRIVLLVLVFTSYWSCADSTKKTATDEVAASTTAVEPIELVTNDLPPMGKDMFDNLYQNTDFVDYIWHELPFSVSQGEKESILQNVAFISPVGLPKVPKKCKSIGRKAYQSKGEIILDADIYFGKDCSYYIFLKDEKPQYLNQMTDDGIKFYANLFVQAEQQRQQLINGK